MKVAIFKKSLSLFLLSLTDEWLCCSSDKGTVHAFALQDYRYTSYIIKELYCVHSFTLQDYRLASYIKRNCSLLCLSRLQVYIVHNKGTMHFFTLQDYRYTSYIIKELCTSLPFKTTCLHRT